MLRQEFDGEMVWFVKFYNHKFTEQQANIWFETFKGQKTNLFSTALHEHVRASEYTSFPAPGKITAVIDNLRNNYYQKEKEFLQSDNWKAKEKCLTPNQWRMCMRVIQYHLKLQDLNIIKNWAQDLQKHHDDYLVACDRSDIPGCVGDPVEEYLSHYMTLLENKYPAVISGGSDIVKSV